MKVDVLFLPSGYRMTGHMICPAGSDLLHRLPVPSKADKFWLQSALYNQLFYHHLSNASLNRRPPDRQASFQCHTLNLPGFALPSISSHRQHRQTCWFPLHRSFSQMSSTGLPFPNHFPLAPRLSTLKPVEPAPPSLGTD